jgi:sugar phosphate isomerase/epimerase
MKMTNEEYGEFVKKLSEAGYDGMVSVMQGDGPGGGSSRILQFPEAAVEHV